MFHSTTQKQVNQLLEALPHGLLLTGQRGVGVSEAAQYIADSLKTTPVVVWPEKDDEVDTKNGTITIDMIRRLYQQTRTAVPQKRIIIIEHAETMGVPAQNAFLKLLEEPTSATHFILVTHNPLMLLPTIRSRVQQLEIRPLTQAQSEELLEELGVKDETARQQIMFLAEGLYAEIKRLAQDSEYLKQRGSQVKQARTLLTEGIYQRLIVAHSLSSDRSAALQLLQDCLLLLSKKATKNHEQAIKRIDTFVDAYEKVLANGNVKLQLARVCYN